LRQEFHTEREYLFSEGDDIQGLSFLISGMCGFVLPKYDNVVYIEIDIGN